MLKNKLAMAAIGAALLSGVVAGAVTIAGADSASTTIGGRIHTSMNPPAAFGNVTAVNGTSITLTDKKSGNTYTVDASSATITSGKNTAATIADIKVGDMIVVEGTVNGSAITATAIHDGMFGHGFGQGRFGGGVMGTVTAINGTAVTVTGKNGGDYTIDATSANVKVNGSASSLANVKVGDTVMIQGTITTASMTATNILDGLPPAPQESQSQ